MNTIDLDGLKHDRDEGRITEREYLLFRASADMLAALESVSMASGMKEITLPKGLRLLIERIIEKATNRGVTEL